MLATKKVVKSNQKEQISRDDRPTLLPIKKSRIKERRAYEVENLHLDGQPTLLDVC